MKEPIIYYPNSVAYADENPKVGIKKIRFRWLVISFLYIKLFWLYLKMYIDILFINKE